MMSTITSSNMQEDSLELLEERRQSIEVQLSSLLSRKKNWQSRETELNNTLSLKTGELAVFTEFFNMQVNLLKMKKRR